MKQKGGYQIDLGKTGAFIFVNPDGPIDQIDEMKLKQSQLQTNGVSAVYTSRDDYNKIKNFIIDEINEKKFCVPNVDAGYVNDQFATDCCVLVWADNQLIHALVNNQGINLNDKVHAFTLLQLELQPIRRIYIDVICTYLGTNPDKNKRAEGAGSLLNKTLRKMADVMQAEAIYLSSVPGAEPAYERMGFRYNMTDKVTNEKRKVNLKDKSPKYRKRVKRRFTKKRISDGDGFLTVMSRPIPTPNTSPALDLKIARKRQNSEPLEPSVMTRTQRRKLTSRLVAPEIPKARSFRQTRKK